MRSKCSMDNKRKYITGKIIKSIIKTELIISIMSIYWPALQQRVNHEARHSDSSTVYVAHQ